MASALIRIDQAAPQTAPTGVAGRGRDDLLLGAVVTCRNSDDTDVNRWRWALLDVPLGSTVVLSSVTASQVSFTPDVVGSYRVQLSINDGLGGETNIKIAGVRDGSGRLYPAADQRTAEANWLVGGAENDKNWAKEVERILRSLGVPQLLNAVQAEAPPAGSASEHIVVGAMGLPPTASAITGYDWVDLQFGANASGPPTVNGLPVLTDQLGEPSGVASICIGDWDIDTTATTVGDQWAFVVLTDATPLLLAKLTMA